MNLPQSEIDAISNLGLAHMGDCVFEYSLPGLPLRSGGKDRAGSCTMTPFRW